MQIALRICLRVLFALSAMIAGVAFSYAASTFMFGSPSGQTVGPNVPSAYSVNPHVVAWAGAATAPRPRREQDTVTTSTRVRFMWGV